MRTSLWLYLCFLLLAFQTNGQIQTPNAERTLHVKGVAILKQIPEMISATINIKVDAPDYSECNDKVMSTLQKAKELFIDKGIEKDLIKTNEIRVSENKTYKNGEEIKLGFIGNVVLSIDTIYSVGFTKNLLSALKSDSIPFNYNISFKLSETQKDLLRKEAIKKAIYDAEEKASIMAESSQVRLDKKISIVYKDDAFVSGGNDSDIIREYSSGDSRLIMIRGIGSNIPTIDFNPKEIKIVKNVEIEYSIKDKPNMF